MSKFASYLRSDYPSQGLDIRVAPCSTSRLESNRVPVTSVFKIGRSPNVQHLSCILSLRSSLNVPYLNYTLFMSLSLVAPGRNSNVHHQTWTLAVHRDSNARDEVTHCPDL